MQVDNCLFVTTRSAVTHDRHTFFGADKFRPSRTRRLYGTVSNFTQP